MHGLRLLACIGVLVLAACTGSVDFEGERLALLEADRSWAAEVAAGADASEVVSYWTSDARVYLSGQDEIHGSEALLEMVTANSAIPGFEVSWVPDEAVVFGSGRFGYTRGTNSFTFPGPDGNLITTHGRYLTIWEKEGAGRWRCMVEMTNEGAPAEGVQP